MKKIFYSFTFLILFSGLVSAPCLFAGKNKKSNKSKNVSKKKRNNKSKKDDSFWADLKKLDKKRNDAFAKKRAAFMSLLQNKKVDSKVRTSMNNIYKDIKSLDPKKQEGRLNTYMNLLEKQNVYFSEFEDQINYSIRKCEALSDLEEYIEQKGIPIYLDYEKVEEEGFGLTEKFVTWSFEKERPFDSAELNDLVGLKDIVSQGISDLFFKYMRNKFKVLLDSGTLSLRDKSIILFSYAFGDYVRSYCKEPCEFDVDSKEQPIVKIFFGPLGLNYSTWEHFTHLPNGLEAYQYFKKNIKKEFSGVLPYYAQASLIYTYMQNVDRCLDNMRPGSVLCDEYKAAKKDYINLFNALRELYVNKIDDKNNTSSKKLKEILGMLPSKKKKESHAALLLKKELKTGEVYEGSSPKINTDHSSYVSVKKMIDSGLFSKAIKEKEVLEKKCQYEPVLPAVMCDKRVLDWYNPCKQKKEPFKDVVRHTFWPIVDSYIMDSNFAITLVNEDDECDESVNIPGAIEFKDGTRLTGVFSYGLAKKDGKVLCWHRWFQTRVLPEILQEFKACMKAVNKKTYELKNDLEIKISVCASDKTIKKMEIPDFFVKYFKENSDDPIKSVTLYYLPTV